MAMETFYPESRFGGFTQIDGTVAFYTRVQALVQPASVVVDFGCGRGAMPTTRSPSGATCAFSKAKLRRVIGLDASPAGADNPFLDEFHCLRARAGRWKTAPPICCICDNVLEHLPDPEQFFAEARRVLRPAAALCIRTPNRWNYIALLSRLIPNRSHASVLAKAKPGLAEEDIFPTFYRCNTISAVAACANQTWV